MPSIASIIPTLLLLTFPTAISAAGSLECSRIKVDGKSYDFDKLGGPKEVHYPRREIEVWANTTFTVDLCKPLIPDTDLPTAQRCQSGTRICGVERDLQPGAGAEWSVRDVIEVAGQYTISDGRHLDPKFTRLNGSASNADAHKEGLRLELHGGEHKGTKQKAIIEFVCDPNVRGTEGFEDTDNAKQRREDEAGDGQDGEEGGEEGSDEDGVPAKADEGHALQFISYDSEDGMDVLRLNWTTKYACDNVVDDDGDNAPQGGKKRGWGFFTWFLIIAFLLAAAYIIFGSWLNYNRYGARGWDLIPHGDTIRDLPYIVKDLGSNVVERLRGSGTRGGYSAV